MKQSFKELENDAKQELWLLKETEIRIEEKLKPGAGGDVFKASWRGLPCVVKTCSKNAPDQILTDLAHEIKVLSTIRHPNLVLFLGAAIVDDKPPLLLTEYCEGGDFEKILIKHTKNGTKLSAKKVTKLGYEVSLAMHFLHHCNPPIIHRDLKPENILLTKTGTIKISDFGLSKLFKTRTEHEKYVMTGETGSYRFMAPEVFKHKEYNEKVDVYSFALIMFWAASGKRPYHSIEEPINVARTVSAGECALSANVFKNPSLRPLFNKGWSIAPEQRPPFVAFLNAYHEIMSSKPDTCIIF